MNIILYLVFTNTNMNTMDTLNKNIDVHLFIKNALKNSNDIINATYDEKHAEINLRESKTAFLPAVSSNFSYNSTGFKTRNQVKTHELNGQLTGEIKLFDGFSNYRKIKRAEGFLKEVYTSQESIKQKIIYSSVHIFLDACLDSQLVEVSTRNVLNQKSLLKKIEALKNAGERPVNDHLTQKAYVADAQINLNASRESYILSKIKIVKLIGDKYSPSEITLLMPHIDSTVMLNRIDQDSIIHRAESRRSDLKELYRKIEIAKSNLHISRSSFFPTLSLGGSLKTAYSDLYNESFSEQLKNGNFQKSVYLTLSLPVFDRMNLFNNIERASVNLSKAKTAYKEFEKQVTIEIREAYHIHHSALEKNKKILIKLESSQRALKAALHRYDSGLLTLSELYSMYTLVNQAEHQAVSSWYSILFSILKIGYYTGDIESIINLLTNRL